MHDLADQDWSVAAPGSNGDAVSVNHAILAVLMDIRFTLRFMRARLDCYETLTIPRLLRDIKRNTTKPRKRKR